MRFSFLNKKILILMIVILLMSPVGAFAFSLGTGGMVPGLPFGGFVAGTLLCGCSTNLWIFFMPLYLSAKPVVGALVYQPGYTTLYGNFEIGVPFTWHLGSYTPIVGNGVCLIVTTTGCVPIPNFGLMNKVGTGLP